MGYAHGGDFFVIPAVTLECVDLGLLGRRSGGFPTAGVGLRFFWSSAGFGRSGRLIRLRQAGRGFLGVLAADEVVDFVPPLQTATKSLVATAAVWLLAVRSVRMVDRGGGRHRLNTAPTLPFWLLVANQFCLMVSHCFMRRLTPSQDR
jgi:hypothetical protein